MPRGCSQQLLPKPVSVKVLVRELELELESPELERPEHSGFHWLVLKSTNLGIKTAFIARCLIFVDQAFTGHMIKNWNSFFVCSFSGRLITCFDRAKHRFYLGAQHRTLTCIALPGFFGLADSLSCLSRICHGLPHLIKIAFSRVLCNVLSLESTA